MVRLTLFGHDHVYATYLYHYLHIGIDIAFSDGFYGTHQLHRRRVAGIHGSSRVAIYLCRLRPVAIAFSTSSGPGMEA